ncbi:uncharacterized protein ChaoS9_275 [Halobacterium phage ChaoS9]|uniref:DUF6884 domain-containing protein n=1 Tax=Halobacterium phage ChaoS9 TaxID=2847105 RepID=A0A481V9V6_9CAUD|nr:uncharacterized protein KMC41_gp56 [Halobacterium phage ChaoS9]QBI90060.1 uncharacterized protein ChaoS9_275 [Halobacterium phage ChaoS9]
MPEQIQCESCGATADVGEPAPDSNPLPDGWSEDLEETDDTYGYRSVYQCPQCSGSGLPFDVALVGCTKRKRDEPAQAGDLYDESPLFRRRRRIARDHAGLWGILSAEHGFVHPATELEPYNTHIRDVDTEAWSAEVLSDLGKLVGAGDRVVILAGAQDYVDPVRAPLRELDVDVAAPLRKQPPGIQYNILDDLMEALDEHTAVM